MKSKRIAICLFALMLTAALPQVDARAGEDPALDDQIAAMKGLVENKRWAHGLAAARRLLSENEGSSEVLARIKEIEPLLRKCLYRETADAPNENELLGEAASGFSRSTRRVTFKYPSGPAGKDWAGSSGSTWRLTHRFEDEVSVEFLSVLMQLPKHSGISIFLNYDRETGSGYQIIPGFQYTDLKDDKIYTLDNRITRWDGGQSNRDLATKPAWDIHYRAKVRVTCRAGAITLSLNGKPVLSANDKKCKAGIVMIQALGTTDLVVRGELESEYVDALEEEFHRSRYDVWAKRKYDRSKVLPAWILEAEQSAGSKDASPVNSGAHRRDSPSVAAALDAWATSDDDVMLGIERNVKEEPPRTRLFLDGLAALARNRYAEAEALLGKLVKDVPEYADGRVARGILFTCLRRFPEARAELEAGRGATRNPRLYLARAELALREGNIDDACEAVRSGGKMGASSRALSRMQTILDNCREGPSFERGFKFSEGNANYDGDAEVPPQFRRKLVSVMNQQFEVCATLFPEMGNGPPPLRVHMFMVEDRFNEYLASIDSSHHWKGVALNRALGEMSILVPRTDEDGFWSALRHDLFHGWSHGGLETWPKWLDEAFAQYCEDAGPGNPEPVPGAESAEGIAALKDAVGSGLTPLPLLMTMDRHEFLENSLLNHAESWILGLILAGKRGVAFRRTMGEYMTSLKSGRTAEEAYADHMAAIVDELEKALVAYVRELK